MRTAPPDSFPRAPALDPADPWRVLLDAPTLADTVLFVSPESRLVPPGNCRPLNVGSPQTGRRASPTTVLESGVHYATLAASRGRCGGVFSARHPNRSFALHPLARHRVEGERGPTLLFVKSRQHLLENIGAFYQRELNSQSALRLIDENGEKRSARRPGGEARRLAGGEPLAESTLQPPLPGWRVQLFSVDSSLVDDVARGQIALYSWSVIGMIAVTAAIAAWRAGR